MVFDKKKDEKVLPVEERPLRMPGQSLEAELDRLFTDKLLFHMVMIGVMVILAGWEWYRYLASLPPRPILTTVLVLPIIGFSAWRIWRVWPEIRAVSIGIKGEKAVAERLTELMAVGYKVLHDIPGKAWNIDHVVIGPAGVFTIETKTLKKRRSASAKVRYDGQVVSVDGMKTYRDPIDQAFAEARELRTIINKSTGKEFGVQPVIIYPGWFVEQLVPEAKVWVFNDKMFVRHIKEQPRKLQDSDVSMIAFHLEQYVRGKG